jgi:hypothetical protein
MIKVLSAVMSFIVVTVNLVLGRVIRIFSAFEQHQTYTKYNLSVASKLTAATFINTAILPIFINMNKD